MNQNTMKLEWFEIFEPEMINYIYSAQIIRYKACVLHLLQILQNIE